MKKAIVLFCVLILIVSALTACSKPPFEMDDQHMKYGEKALEIADKFLDYEMTLEEAKEKLEEMEALAGTLPELPESDDKRFGNDRVVARVQFLSWSFIHSTNLLGQFTSKDAKEILESRNELAKILGKPER